MKSKSSSRRSVLVCTATSLALCRLALAQPPAIALADAADAAGWQQWAAGAGFAVIAGAAASTADARVQSLAAAVQQAIASRAADPARIYLVGRGPAAAGVFYTISRLPDLWAAAIAVEGSPERAVETNRIFAANFSTFPLLWISSAPDGEQTAAKLKAAGLPFAWRPAAGFSDSMVAEWLRQHQRDPFPMAIDCETNSPTFASCYWIRMTKFDAAERNDVLPSSRISAGAGAALDLGAFSYKTGDPGPGVLVADLGEKYKGPLKLNDRLVALDGRPIENPRALAEMLARYTEEKPVTVTVQRGKERVRVETRVVLPSRETIVTARVQASYSPSEKVIQIVSRTVKEMRVTIPAAWAGDASLYWNGLVLDKVAEPGCILLAVENGILHAGKCQ
jgi:hypothetical protein